MRRNNETDVDRILLFDVGFKHMGRYVCSREDIGRGHPSFGTGMDTVFNRFGCACHDRIDNEAEMADKETALSTPSSYFPRRLCHFDSGTRDRNDALDGTNGRDHYRDYAIVHGGVC